MGPCAWRVKGYWGMLRFGFVSGLVKDSSLWSVKSRTGKIMHQKSLDDVMGSERSLPKNANLTTGDVQKRRQVICV